MTDLYAYYYHPPTEPGTAVAPAETTYYDAVMALSPTGYWRMGEASGNLADSSGNGLSLTVTGSPTYGATGWASDGDDAITLSGTQWFSRADEDAFDIGTNDYSLSWVMKRSGTPSTEMTVFGHDGQGYDGEWDVHLSGLSNLIVVRVYNTGYNLFHTATLYDDALHHCVVTCDRSANAVLYVDGAAAGTADISAQVSADLTNARPFVLGGAGDSYRPLTATLDEAVYWKTRLLTSGEVSTLYGAR